MPTRHLVSLIAVLIAVCYAAISQGNGPAYLPAYALFSLLLVSWLHNHSTVQQLELTTHCDASSFAGAVLLLPFALRNKKKKPKFGLKLTTSLGGSSSIGKLTGLVEGTISIPGLTRGIYRIDSLQVTSIFPLGVFQARSRHPVSCECSIYPEPLGELPLPGGSGTGQPENTGQRIQGDDFAGVRLYSPGESQRHIDWKAVARGQPLMIKQFENTTQRGVWLTGETLRALHLEAQLSQMTRWIMQSERAGLRYGLRMGQVQIAPSQGNTHYHRCLRALAVFPHSR